MDTGTIDNKRIEALAKQYHLRLLVLFGSQARKDARPSSDADVAYLAGKTLSLIDEARLGLELEGILRRPVDLANMKEATPLLLYHVFEDGLPLYEHEPGLFTDRCARAIRIYEETMPLYRIKLSRL